MGRRFQGLEERFNYSGLCGCVWGGAWLCLWRRQAPLPGGLGLFSSVGAGQALPWHSPTICWRKEGESRIAMLRAVAWAWPYLQVLGSEVLCTIYKLCSWPLHVAYVPQTLLPLFPSQVTDVSEEEALFTSMVICRVLEWQGMYGLLLKANEQGMYF